MRRSWSKAVRCRGSSRRGQGRGPRRHRRSDESRNGGTRPSPATIGKCPPCRRALRGERGRQNVIRTEGGVLRPSGAVDDTRLRCQSALCKWGDRPIGNWVIKRQRSSEDLHDEGQLRKRLDRLADDKDPSILLVHPSGQELSIDLKGTLAHVEYIPRAWRDRLLAASTLPTDKISKQT